ncbi:MAG: GAF domain-containing protein [Chloroflexaceae bacterium]|nr:GAF domain-containing protein [Chloroflexaceae bacterium]
MGTSETSSFDIRPSALQRIVSAIETATTLDELLLLCLNELTHLLNISQAAIVMLRDDHASSRLEATYPPRTDLPRDPIPLSATPHLRQVLESRQPLQVTNAQELPGPSVYLDLVRLCQVCSLLIVPLVSQDQVTGFLILGTEERGSGVFVEPEIVLARMLAGQIAAAITSFTVTEAAQRRSDELATLNDISAAVTSSLNTQEIYHMVVQKLNEYFQVEAGSLLMRDEQTGDLEFVMTLEAGIEKLVGVRVPRGEGVVGYVAEKQRYAIVSHPEEDPRFYRKISEDTGYPPALDSLCAHGGQRPHHRGH